MNTEGLKISAILCLGFFLFVGCAAEPAYHMEQAASSVPDWAPVAAETASSGDAPGGGDVQLALHQPGTAPQYLIKTARVTIEAGDPAQSLRTLTEAVVGRGGYVARLNDVVNNLGVRHVTAEVRVPAAQLEETMLQLEGLGRVMEKDVSTQDVSEEYLDTDARMRNLKATEERVLAHLNRMGSIEDILKVETELTRVRQQIEQFEGRLRYLDQRVTYSSIHCTFLEAPKAGPVTPTSTFSTAKEFSAALRSLVAFAQVAWVVIIWMAVWSPVWFFCMVLPLFVLVRRGRHRAANLPEMVQPSHREV